LKILDGHYHNSLKGLNIDNKKFSENLNSSNPAKLLALEMQNNGAVMFIDFKDIKKGLQTIYPGLQRFGSGLIYIIINHIDGTKVQ
jgi:hypothetical protein